MKSHKITEEEKEMLNEMNYILHSIKEGSATKQDIKRIKYLDKKLSNMN